MTWREQIDDVAQAVVAARSAFIARGANPAALFLMGHSAGAQLVTRVALDPAPLARAGGSSAFVCGVIPVSGAALDLTDQQTWDLGAKLDYYRERFATGGEPDWQKLASPMTFLTAKAPPFLVIHSGRESKPLRRQSEWLVDRCVSWRCRFTSSSCLAAATAHRLVAQPIGRYGRSARRAVHTTSELRSLGFGLRLRAGSGFGGPTSCWELALGTGS